MDGLREYITGAKLINVSGKGGAFAFTLSDKAIADGVTIKFTTCSQTGERVIGSKISDGMVYTLGDSLVAWGNSDITITVRNADGEVIATGVYSLAAYNTEMATLAAADQLADQPAGDPDCPGPHPGAGAGPVRHAGPGIAGSGWPLPGTAGEVPAGAGKQAKRRAVHRQTRRADPHRALRPGGTGMPQAMGLRLPGPVAVFPAGPGAKPGAGVAQSLAGPAYPGAGGAAGAILEAEARRRTCGEL